MASRRESLPENGIFAVLKRFLYTVPGPELLG
jgi:hypothetical protein